VNRYREEKIAYDLSEVRQSEMRERSSGKLLAVWVIPKSRRTKLGVDGKWLYETGFCC